MVKTKAKRNPALDARGYVREDATLEELAKGLRALGIEPEELLRLALEGEMTIGRLTGSLRSEDAATLEAKLGKMGIFRDPKDGLFVFPGRRKPWDALRSYPQAIFSPTLAAMVYYVKYAAMPRWSTDAADAEPRRGENFEDTTPALRFLKQIGTALLPPLKGHPLWRRESVQAVLVLAREIQAEAEAFARRLPDACATVTGEPNREAIKRARELVAGRQPMPKGKKLKPGEVWKGISVEALQKRIREARNAEPDAGWPAIMPERRGNRRA